MLLNYFDTRLTHIEVLDPENVQLYSALLKGRAMKELIEISGTPTGGTVV